MTFSFKHGDRPLDGYTVQRGVGRGGFGEVYYALSDSGKEVALKYLRDNPQIELRGVSHCMNLKSPYLVTVYDIKQNAAGEYFIIMEYVSGPSLRDLLVAEGDKGLGPQKAAYFLREIGKGLGYLHDRGIVHRDLKPGNIFYEDGYVKIGDYGLSKFISVSQHSVQTASVGTVHYMAPEVGTGNYHRGIDIYALGVILFEMLLGRVPYEGSSMGEVLMKHLMAQPEVDSLPAPFGAVITKALAKDPKDRYQTVDEMTEALFGVDDVRDSVARFEPTSVSMAAARAVPAHVAAGVGGSSGEVNLPPPRATAGVGSSAAGAWGQADEPRPGPQAPGWTWGDRWRSRREGRRERIRDRMAEVETRLRGIEGVRAGEPPKFPPRSRWVAGILGVFLGALGIHRFYLGYTRIGIIQIVLTMFTGGTAGLWGFVEGILILAGIWGEDVYGRPVVSRRPSPPVMLQSQWFERLLVAILVAIALSAGVAMVFGQIIPASGNRTDTFLNTFGVVLTFVVAMTMAAMVGSLVALRLRMAPAPPLLGRLVVFGIGLLALLGASAFCEETFPPPRYYVQPVPLGFQQDGSQFRNERLSQEAWMQDRSRFAHMLESLVGGLAVAMVLVNWAKLLKRGTEGRVELGSAVWAGVVAGGAACFFWDGNYFALVAGIGATTSLTVQSAAFFRLRGPGDTNAGPPGADRERAGASTDRNDGPVAVAPGSEGNGGPVAFAEANAYHRATIAAAGPAKAVRSPHHGLSEQACTDRARRVWQSIVGACFAVPVVAILGSSLDVDNDVMPLCLALGAGIAGVLPWLTYAARRRYSGRRVEALAAGASPVSASDVTSPDLATQRAQARDAILSGFILHPPAEASAAQQLPLRSTATRVFWGMVAAALLCVTIMCIVALGAVNMGHDEAGVALAFAFAAGALQVLPLSKLTRRRRYGFYAETLRPLFIAICLATAAAALGVMSATRLGSDETFVAIGFIVVGIVFALFFALVRGSTPSLRQ